jgi:hypothetical protein
VSAFLLGESSQYMMVALFLLNGIIYKTKKKHYRDSFCIG